jgi:hypothetical protein
MMKAMFIRFIALGMLLGMFAGVAPARAGTSFDFLFSMDRVTNDRQLFLNLAVSDSGYSRATLEPVLPRIRYVDEDLPVVLFLAQRCHQPVEAIVDLRAQGLSWSVVFTQVGVPLDTLFVGIDQDPGPPYGKAWGYWRQRRSASVIADADVRGLVQVQLGSRWVGTSPYELARAQGHGRPVVVAVAEKHGHSYGKGNSGAHGNGHHRDE